jgi:hypothetical protein
MDDDLFREVQAGLAARRDDWNKIAADLAPLVSRSWIYQVATGIYRSAPSYHRLQAVKTYLLTGKVPDELDRRKSAAA